MSREGNNAQIGKFAVIQMLVSKVEETYIARVFHVAVNCLYDFGQDIQRVPVHAGRRLVPATVANTATVVRAQI